MVDDHLCFADTSLQHPFPALEDLSSCSLCRVPFSPTPTFNHCSTYRNLYLPSSLH